MRTQAFGERHVARTAITSEHRSIARSRCCGAIVAATFAGAGGHELNGLRVVMCSATMRSLGEIADDCGAFRLDGYVLAIGKSPACVTSPADRRDRFRCLHVIGEESVINGSNALPPAMRVILSPYSLAPAVVVIGGLSSA